MDASRNYADALYDVEEAERATTAAGLAAQEVIAGRVADFETMMGATHGLASAIGEAWGTATGTAEEMSARQVAANEAIIESYNDVALAIVQSGLQESIAEGGADAETAALGYIAMELALGTITQEEAAQLQQVALETLAIADATDEMTARFLADGKLTTAEARIMAAEIKRIGDEVRKIPTEYKVKFVSDLSQWQVPSDFGGQNNANTGQIGGVQMATGGQFTVPTGYPNDSFPMWVESGERVTVETPSQQSAGTFSTGGDGNSGGHTFNFYGMDISDVRNLLREEGVSADSKRRMS